MIKDPRKDIVLLLTGTVNVNNKHFTVHTDAATRRIEYINTIRFHLNRYPYPVVFVENSNEDLSEYFAEAISSQKLEVLYFDGNDYLADLGKGLGELRCIRHAVENASFFKEDSFIFKITGRYQIVNLPDFIKDYLEDPSIDLLADLTGNFRYSASAIFGFRPFFARTYLFKNEFLLDDRKRFFFEHSLAKAVLEAIGDNIKFKIFKHYPKIKAVSGTTGKPYNKSFFYLLPRHFKYWLRYHIVIR